MRAIEVTDPPAGGGIDRPAPVTRPPAWRRPGVRDLAAVLAYLALAIYVTANYWARPGTQGATSLGGGDQMLFEWMLSHAARSMAELSNPLYSYGLYAPDGVNVMANTSVLGLGIPLIPVTMLFGPNVAWSTMIALSFAGNAAAWYFVLSRHVVGSRFAAFVGATLCGFSPGLLSQANGHPHILAQFLLPVIAWQVFRLGESTRPVRAGIVLGLLLTYQVFIGEETLFFTALACGVTVLAYAVFRPQEALARWRPFVTGLAVAAGVAVVLLAYPLYSQFFGSGHYRGLPGFSLIFNADAGAYPRFSQLSLAGEVFGPNKSFAQNNSELNAFFGLPLLLAATAIVVWLRRDLAVRLTAVVAVVFTLLSLGTVIEYAGKSTGMPGPWRLLVDLPLFDAVVPTRFALITAVALGVLLALGLDRAVRREPGKAGEPQAAMLWSVIVLAALLPILPRPLPTATIQPVPQFFAGETWREYLGPTDAVMALPPNSPLQRDSMRWAAHQLNAFRVTDGYFIRNDPESPERFGTMFRPITPFTKLILDAYRSGTPSVVTDADRAQAREDLARRGAALVVMRADQPGGDAIRATADALLGPGRLVDDVWLWDLRPGAAR